MPNSIASTAAVDGEARAGAPATDVVPQQRSGSEALEVPAGQPSSLAADVVNAVALGWSITTLFRVLERPDDNRADAAYLPRDDELTAAEAARRYLERVVVGTQRLEHHVATAPTAALDAVKAELGRKGSNRRSAASPQARIRELHVALLCSMAAADSRLGRSYALGVALARLADRAGGRGRGTAAGTRDRSGRAVAKLHEELLALHDSVRDLATVLPPHAGQAVRESIARWIVYVEGERRKSMERKSSDRAELLLLQRQVFLWKALLVGEKDALDSLSPHEYLAVGVEALKRLKRHALLVLRAVSGPLPLLILVAGAALVGVALWQSATSTATAGVISTIAGTVAAAWRTNRGTVADMLADYRRTITGAAMESAIASAITLLPPDASTRVKRKARKHVLIPNGSGAG